MFRLARTTIKAGRVKEKTLKRRNHNATGGRKSRRRSKGSRGQGTKSGRGKYSRRAGAARNGGRAASSSVGGEESGRRDHGAGGSSTTRDGEHSGERDTDMSSDSGSFDVGAAIARIHERRAGRK